MRFISLLLPIPVIIPAGIMSSVGNKGRPRQKKGLGVDLYRNGGASKVVRNSGKLSGS